MCAYLYIYINIDRRRRESHVVLHLSIPNPFDPLIQRVDYMHSLAYIYTTFSYIARYKYKFIDISLREEERWVSIDGINRIDSKRYKREEALQTCSRLVSLAPFRDYRFASSPVLQTRWINFPIYQSSEKEDKEGIAFWGKSAVQERPVLPFRCPRGPVGPTIIIMTRKT